MQPQEPAAAPLFELNQGQSSRQGHLPRAFLSRSNAFLTIRPPSSPPRASLSRSNAFTSIRQSPPSSPDGSQSGGSLSPPSLLPHAILLWSDAFPPRRLPSSSSSSSSSSSPPSSPDGSQSGGSLSPPSLLPHAPIPSGGELLPHSSSSIAFGSSKSAYSYDEFMYATDGFSVDNLLGQGGFGSVYKGILSDGKEVAVKKLKAGSGQGEREFQAEVMTISRVHHRHLVSLVGYCSTGSQRLLAYEFVPNGTLAFHLHGQGRPTMDWSIRRRIALGSAKGLAYLHEDCHPRIIHRDIKAANILLDSKFEAKVADFGLAKYAPDSNTHVSTQVKGTIGYLDPEYAYTGQLTDKSDVYSYGVVLLQLITGRPWIDKANPDMHVSLVEWARGLKENKHMVDSRLKVFDRNEMTRIIACAEACTRLSAKDRPKMSTVVRVLEGAVSIEKLNEDNSQQHKKDTRKSKIGSFFKRK